MNRRAVFLDRDGVINQDSKDHIKSLAEWYPIAGSLEAIARLSESGYRVVVITNQSGLARGLMDEAALSAIHDALHERVAALGGRVDGIFYCPHGPDDGCACRKPAPGLIHQAVEALGVEASGAPFVGDRATDLAAARAAGCRPVFIGSESDLAASEQSADTVAPAYPSLAAFVDQFLGGSARSGVDAGGW